MTVQCTVRAAEGPSPQARTNPYSPAMKKPHSKNEAFSTI